MINKINITY